MAHETYSVAVTGSLADSKNFRPQTLTVGDTYARSGGQQRAAMNGAQITCRGPDLSEANYTIDAERSDPSKGLIYLLKV